MIPPGMGAYHSPSGITHPFKTVDRVDFTDGNGNTWERRHIPALPRPFPVRFEAFWSWWEETDVLTVLMCGTSIVRRMPLTRMVRGGILTFLIESPKGESL